MSARTALRALVVEDEPLARAALRELLEAVDWMEVVGEAADGLAAVRLIDDLEPDVVFLDVHLPELDGLAVLEQIRHDPMVVFTTAHDRYAVAAFEHEAVDYLVKPFGRRRLQATLDRLRARIGIGEAAGPEAAAEGAADAGPAASGEKAARRERALRRVYARRGSRIVPLPIAAISRIEASGDATVVWCGLESFHLARSLGELEQRLDRERFRRIHRSLIVNLDQVSAMEFSGRQLVLTLRDGTRTVASRAATRELRRLIE